MDSDTPLPEAIGFSSPMLGMVAALLPLLETEFAESLRTSWTREGRWIMPLIGPPATEPGLALPLLAPSTLVMTAPLKKFVEALCRVDTEDGGSVARDQSQYRHPAVRSFDLTRAIPARPSQLRFARGSDTRNLELSVESETTIVGKLEIEDSSTEVRRFGGEAGWAVIAMGTAGFEP